MAGVTDLRIEWRAAPRRPDRVAGEFVFDGRTLWEHVERASGTAFDLASPIGWLPPDGQIAFAERLLLRRPAVLPSGRRELLVCPECGDLGCGCVSAEVRADGDRFVWGRFGYENDFDPALPALFPMGELTIDAAALTALLCRHIPGLTA